MLENRIEIVGEEIELSKIICIYEFSEELDWDFSERHYVVFVYEKDTKANFYGYEINLFKEELTEARNALAERGIIIEWTENYNPDFFSKVLFPMEDKGKPFYVVTQVGLIKRMINNLLFKENLEINKKLLCMSSISKIKVCKGYDIFD